jgi:membrane protein
VQQLTLQFHNLYCVFRRFSRDRCLSRAAELTFTTLLAIVPLMMVGLVIFTAFPKFAVLGDKAQDFIFSHFVPSTGQVIQSQLNLWVKKSIQLSWIGMTSLLVTAIFVLFSIESAFNAIWRIRKSRNFIEAFFLYWGILSLAPLLLGSFILFFTQFFSWVAGNATWYEGEAKRWVWSGLIFLLTGLWFTLLYRLLPNRISPTKNCFIAGMVAALLFELARQGFAVYINTFSTYTIVYGALAAIPIFLLWLYLSWVIILWGAELIQILPYWHTHLIHRRQTALTRALLLLKILYDNKHRYGYEAWLKLAPGDELALARTELPQLPLEEKLEKAGIIACANKKIKLTADLNQLTLYEVLQAIYYPDLTVGELHLKEPLLKEILQQGVQGMQETWNKTILSLISVAE